MAAFGGTTCSRVVGPPQAARETVTSWEVPGINGTGYHLHGLHGRPYAVRLILYSTGALVDAWYTTVQGMQGQTVLYTDDWDTVSGSVFVENISRLQKTVAIGEGGARGECTATVRPV